MVDLLTTSEFYLDSRSVVDLFREEYNLFPSSLLFSVIYLTDKTQLTQHERK